VKWEVVDTRIPVVYVVGFFHGASLYKIIGERSY
jgi:hypothetical protein